MDKVVFEIVEVDPSEIPSLVVVSDEDHVKVAVDVAVEANLVGFKDTGCAAKVVCVVSVGKITDGGKSVGSAKVESNKQLLMSSALPCA